MSSVNIRDLCVVFKDGTVGLNRLSLEIESGDFVALVGPSGSGKTTLLRAIAGFAPLTDGAIVVGGRDVSAVPTERRNMGMVFQEHAVWPHMTILRNVEYPLRRAGVDKNERMQKAQRALDLVGLAGMEKRSPSSLSGGQRQRVALARAIVGNPAVLLLDEALSALDEPLRDSLRRELVTLTRKSGQTTIHVTHDRHEALAIADKIAVLRDGKIEQYSTPQDILHKPGTAWVASFMGDATVLDARVENGILRVRNLGLAWPYDGPLKGDVVVAVLPEHVNLARNDSEGDAVEMEIESVLFGAMHLSVTMSYRNETFRANVPVTQGLQVGQIVAAEIRPPLVYEKDLRHSGAPH